MVTMCRGSHNVKLHSNLLLVFYRGYPPLQEQIANYVAGAPLPRSAGTNYSLPLRPLPVVVPTSTPTPRASSSPPSASTTTTSQVPTQVDKEVPSSSTATAPEVPLPEGRDGGEDAPLPEGEGDRKKDEGEETPKGPTMLQRLLGLQGQTASDSAARQPDDDDDDGEVAHFVSSTGKAFLTVTSSSSGPEILDTIDTVALASRPKSSPDPKHGMMPPDPPGDGNDGRRPGRRSPEKDLGRSRSPSPSPGAIGSGTGSQCGSEDSAPNQVGHRPAVAQPSLRV